MFLEERYEKILYTLNIEGRVKVKTLAKAFDVTEDCIRKDLKELENRGLLKRVYGGAIISKTHIDLKPIDERQHINSSEKKEIALKALDLIENNDILFLDTSTINLEIAKLLKDKDMKITVISNMMEVILELKNNNNIKTICIGGEFNKEVGAVVGSAANRYITNFSYDKSFIGVCGVNMEKETLSTIYIEDGSTKKTIIDCSNKSYVVMEDEKLNYDEFYKFASFKDIDAIISEKEILYTNN